MKLQLRKGKEIDRSDMKGNNFVTTVTGPEEL